VISQYSPSPRQSLAPSGRRLVTTTLAAAALLALAGCGGNGATRRPYAQNSPPAAGPPVIPAGMQKDGQLYTSCALTYTDGVPTGATIKLYNPGGNPVQVTGIGIEQISNGILMSTLPVQTADFPGLVAAGIELTEPVTFDSGSSATSCQAGWQ